MTASAKAQLKILYRWCASVPMDDPYLMGKHAAILAVRREIKRMLRRKSR